MSTTLSLKVFLNRIAEATTQNGFTVEKQEGSYLFVKVHDQTHRFNLKMAYDTYRGAPAHLDDIINAHLKVLRTLPEVRLPSEQEAIEALLPILQTTHWAKQAQEREVGVLFQRPFVTGLIIGYVLDMPASRAYVSSVMAQEMMASGITVDELHQYALQNLRKLVKEYNIQIFGSQYETMIVCETREGYAAMGVLLPELMDEWNARIPGQMLIGIPNRDFIIAVSARHPAGLGDIKQQLRRDARNRMYPLTPRLLSWRDGQIREYQPLN